MDKKQAIELLGGSIAEAARAIGVTYHAVYKWPEKLTRRISDRVEAALERKRKLNRSSRNVNMQLPTA